MNSITFLGFLIASSAAYSLHDYLYLEDEELGDRYTTDDADVKSDQNYTIEKEMKTLEENKVPNNLSVFHEIKEKIGKNNKTESEIWENVESDETEILESISISLNENLKFLPTSTEVKSDDSVSNRLSKIHQNNYNDKISQPPNRREVPYLWKPSDDPENDNEMFSNFDGYDSKYFENDYGDYHNLPNEPMEKENSTFVDLNQKESAITTEQLIKYNDQRDHYSPIRDVYRSSPNEYYSDEPFKRQRPHTYKKYVSKNSCRQYLEFLKYAFESLDETEQKYEYDNDYSDDVEPKEWREKLPPKKLFPFPHSLNLDSKMENENINENNKIPPYVSFTTLSPLPVTSTLSTFSYNKALNPFFRANTVSRGRENSISTSTWKGDTNVYSSTVGQTKKQTESEIVSMTPRQNDSERSLVRVTEKTNFGKNHQQRILWENREPAFKTFDRSTKIPGHQRWLFPHNYYKNLETASNKIKPTTPSATVQFDGLEITSSRSVSIQEKEANITRSAILSMSTTYSNSTMVASQGTTPRPINASKNLEDCNDKNLPCPDTYNITYPLNGYCNRYVSCESGRAIRRTCPNGLHFNIITRSCDLPHNSFCNYVCPNPEGYYGIPGDCNGYFVCKDSFPVYRMCPPKMHWDVEKDFCTFEDSSSCPMKCSGTNEIKPYEGDCKAYVICLNGISYYHKCPPNTKFDPSGSICSLDHMSQCKDNPKLITKLSNSNPLCSNMDKNMGPEILCNSRTTTEKAYLEH